VLTFIEQKRIKKVEGVAPNPAVLQALAKKQQKDLELGLLERKKPVVLTAAPRRSLDKVGQDNINPVDSRS
jgi:hypothetical protein